MTDSARDVTADGARLIKAFLGAQEDLASAERSVSSSRCELNNAERALAKWLMPSDMKAGEKVAVWMGDSLFQVELAPQTAYAVEGGEPVVRHEPKVTIRTRGHEFHRLRNIA